jgi:hypothetical protein
MKYAGARSGKLAVMRPRFAITVISTVAGVAGALACRQIAGITDSPPMDPTTSACGLPYGSSACASCASRSCCGESSACATEAAACGLYESCVGACNGDPTCRAQCEVDHPAGTASTVSALSACLASYCADECGVPCGGTAGLAVPPDAAPGFQSCLGGSGCSEVLACASSTSCDAVNRCFAACPTNDCIDTCMADHGVDPAWWLFDAGAAPLTPTFASFAKARASCAKQAGNDWACVGRLSMPPVEASATTLETVVNDLTTSAPLAGATVTACTVDDVDCSRDPPWATGQTDELGRLSMSVPVLAGPPAGYLKVISTTTVPTYSYWGAGLAWSRYVFSPGRSGANTNGVLVITAAEAQALNSGGLTDAGTLDPNRAIVMVYVEDCLAAPAAGVLVTLSNADGETVTTNGLGVRTSTTDTGALLTFSTVRPGQGTVTATPVGLSQAAAVVAFTAHAGALNFVNVRPTAM